MHVHLCNAAKERVYPVQLFWANHRRALVPSTLAALRTHLTNNMTGWGVFTDTAAVRAASVALRREKMHMAPAGRLPRRGPVRQ